MSRCVEVRTNCRLHFGLTSFGYRDSRPQFGGVGVMVAAPGVHLRIRSAEKFSVSGLLQDRVSDFANTVVQQLGLSALPGVCIEALATPAQHSGLGVGTQLGSAVAAGLAEAMGTPWREPNRLVQLARRGERSGIGTYGFLMGGFLVDEGHAHGEPLGRLAYQSSFPEEWQFVLITPNQKSGLAGSAEAAALESLPPVPTAVTEELEQITRTQLIPSLSDHDFDQFGAGLYQYGCLAGSCFAPVQGGVYASSESQNIVTKLRGHGIEGVGQSSWGPTLFALCRDVKSAAQVCDDLLGAHELIHAPIIVSAANRGAEVSIVARESYSKP